MYKATRDKSSWGLKNAQNFFLTCNQRLTDVDIHNVHIIKMIDKDKTYTPKETLSHPHHGSMNFYQKFSTWWWFSHPLWFIETFSRLIWWNDKKIYENNKIKKKWFHRSTIYSWKTNLNIIKNWKITLNNILIISRYFKL